MKLVTNTAVWILENDWEEIQLATLTGNLIEPRIIDFGAILNLYGVKISPDRFFLKPWQFLNETPEFCAVTDLQLEATNWKVWQLTSTITSDAARTMSWNA
jgi:ribulose kinase